MTVVFFSFFIILLFFPGLIFRYILNQGKNRKIKISNIEQFYWSVIPSVIFHLMVLAIIYQVDLLPNPSLTKLSLILTDIKNISLLEGNDSFTLFVLYYFSVSILGGLMGFGCRALIIETKLYSFHRSFQVDDKWTRKFEYKYIKQKYSPPEGIDSGYKSSLTIVIDILTEGDKDEKALYSGMLYDFHVDSDDELISIDLINVHRKKFADSGQVEDQLTKDSKEEALNEDENEVELEYFEVKFLDESFYAIDGHNLIIQWDDIFNMNITYCYLDKDGDLLILKRK